MSILGTLAKAVRTVLIQSGCTLTVLVLCVSGMGNTARAAEVMESAFDRYLITIVAQTPQGNPAVEGEVMYIDTGEEPDVLIEKAATDFFRSRRLDLEDYKNVWQERTFEGLLERGNGLMVRQYRAKVVYRRKDTAAPLPITDREKEEIHELSKETRKAAEIVRLGIIFCLIGSYFEWERVCRRREERRKR